MDSQGTPEQPKEVKKIITDKEGQEIIEKEHLDLLMSRLKAIPDDEIESITMNIMDLAFGEEIWGDLKKVEEMKNEIRKKAYKYYHSKHKS